MVRVAACPCGPEQEKQSEKSLSFRCGSFISLKIWDGHSQAILQRQRP